jgi:hypothetical protein
MERALMLLLHQPQYLVDNVPFYLHMVFNPLEGGLMSAIPLTGTLALVACIVLAWTRHEAAVWWVLPPLVVSQLLVASGALMLGQSSLLLPALIVSALAELGLLGLLVYRCRRSRLAGVLGGWFALSFYYVAVLDSVLSFAAG